MDRSNCPQIGWLVLEACNVIVDFKFSHFRYFLELVFSDDTFLFLSNFKNFYTRDARKFSVWPTLHTQELLGQTLLVWLWYFKPFFIIISNICEEVEYLKILNYVDIHYFYTVSQLHHLVTLSCSLHFIIFITFGNLVQYCVIVIFLLVFISFYFSYLLL